MLITFWPLGLLYVALLDFSRVFIGVHFPFDVVAGTILGWAIARFALLAYEVYVARWLDRRRGMGTAGHAVARVVGTTNGREVGITAPGLTPGQAARPEHATRAAGGKVRRVAANPWVARLELFGYVVWGVLFIIVGVLAVEVALRAGGRPPRHAGRSSRSPACHSAKCCSC